ILEKKRICVSADMRFGVAVEQRCRFQSARRGAYGDCTHTLSIRKYPRCRAITQPASRSIVRNRVLARQKRHQSVAGPFGIRALPEAESTFRIRPRPAILMAGHHGAAEPHGVGAEEVVDLIADLDGIIRPLDLG